MAPPPPTSAARPSHPPVAQPRQKIFDPWNSSATGHQRPDMRPGLGWRDSRNTKLRSQFAGGHTGGERLSDTYGAGSEDFDEQLNAVVPKAVRARAKLSVMDMLAKPGSMRAGSAGADERSSGQATTTATTATVEDGLAAQSKQGIRQDTREQQEAAASTRTRGIFDGLVIYINGSTAPLVSDHKLKRVLVENGASMSLHLGRRQVTHVIVGKPAAGGLGSGSGGGLAGGKLEKEVKRRGGCSVCYVGVEWVLESLKAGKRLPESRFASLKMARHGQRSVLGLYSAQSKSV